MEEVIKPTKKEQARVHSATYYYRHKEEIRRRRVMALMARGHLPKKSTLEKLKLQAAT
jgi:hypothetical protein